MIGIGSPIHLVIIITIAVIAMLVFAAATQGYFLVRSRWYETLLLLLVAFTLFRPGFWWDMIYPPYEEEPGTRLIQLAETEPRHARTRIWVEGMNLDGDDISKGVLLLLGEPAANGRERLAKQGLQVMPLGEELQILGVRFGSQAEKLGLEQGWRITHVETPVDRPAKEWMFIPALLLLGGIMWAQRRRLPARKST